MIFIKNKILQYDAIIIICPKWQCVYDRIVILKDLLFVGKMSDLFDMIFVCIVQKLSFQNYLTEKTQTCVDTSSGSVESSLFKLWSHG